jgi:hypothetical protein
MLATLLASIKTDPQRYYVLMALTCGRLAPAVVDKVVLQGHTATFAQLNAVRLGRSSNNLPWLIDLIKVGLPDFVIPAELLPAEAPAQPATLFAHA